MINFSSSQQLKTLFFGGSIKVTKKVPILNEIGVPQTFKSGNKKGELRYKNVEEEVKIEGFGLKPLKEWITEKGNVSVNEKVLKVLAKKKTHVAGNVAQMLLRRRYLEKQIGTYFDGVEKFIYDVDNCVHAELCHFGYEVGEDGIGGATQTGRLSSHKPNIQNQPRKNTSVAKQHFTSRFKDGLIIEFDYAALEVVGAAYLSQDRQLIDDLVNGVNIHRVLAAQLLNKSEEDVTDEERTNAKRDNFLLLYGGGVGRLVKDRGHTKDSAKLFINNFYKRYPQLKIWQDNLVKKVEATATYIDEFTKDGHKIQEGVYQNVTGRLLYFKTKDAPNFLKEKGIMTGFNPPDIKNYPVQSFSTADLVLIMVGQFFKEAIKHRDKFLMINTVHDSLIIDCKKEYIEFACNLGKTVLESAKDVFKEKFNLDINVPIKVEYKVGSSWYDC